MKKREIKTRKKFYKKNTSKLRRALVYSRKKLYKKNTRKQKRVGGGPLWGYASMLSKPSANLTSTTTQNKIIPKKNLFQMSSDKDKELKSTAANVALVGTVASNVGYGAVSILALSGVGLPLAGAIAGSLLIANKLANMYLSNLELFPIMYDSMTILTNSHKLNNLIGKAYEVIRKHIPDITDFKNREDVEKVKINEEIKSHILKKVNDLTAYLLQISTDEVLNVLINDEDLKKSGFNKVVEEEIQSRNNGFNSTFLGKKIQSKSLSYLSKQTQKLSRGANRYFYSADIKNKISNNLSLISSFFIIIKSQYDFALQMYQHEFPNWNNILKEIEATDEYKDYLIPVVNPSEAATAITNKSMNEIQKAVSTAVKSVDEVDEEKDQLLKAEGVGVEVELE